jgi:hypothetical protein
VGLPLNLCRVGIFDRVRVTHDSFRTSATQFLNAVFVTSCERRSHSEIGLKTIVL